MCWVPFLILPAVLFVKIAVDYVYPGQFKNMAMKVGWDALEITSRVEIYVSKLYNYLPAILPRPPPQQLIKFIGEGEEIDSFTLNEFINKKKEIKIAYDFILYEIPIKTQSIYEKYDKYVVRYHDINDVMRLEYTSFKCFELNLIQITINETDNYTIDFGRSQFMVSGNVLFDKPFIKWYLNTFKNIVLDDEDKYVVSFIDHNMNYVTVPSYCYILVKKNSYDIVNVI